MGRYGAWEQLSTLAPTAAAEQLATQHHQLATAPPNNPPLPLPQPGEEPHRMMEDDESSFPSPDGGDANNNSVDDANNANNAAMSGTTPQNHDILPENERHWREEDEASDDEVENEKDTPPPGLAIAPPPVNVLPEDQSAKEEPCPSCQAKSKMRCSDPEKDRVCCEYCHPSIIQARYGAQGRRQSTTKPINYNVDEVLGPCIQGIQLDSDSDDESLSDEDYYYHNNPQSSSGRSRRQFKKKSKKKESEMTLEELAVKFDGMEAAEHVHAYHEWRKTVVNEGTGDDRKLFEVEVRYHDVKAAYFGQPKSVVKKISPFETPPDIFQSRFESFHRTVCSRKRDHDGNFIINEKVERLFKGIIGFSEKHCSDMQRSKWMEVFPAKLRNDPTNREAFRILSIMFVKGTNGTADKVACEHFKKICSHESWWKTLSLEAICKDKLLVPRFMRQCGGKWVKFSVALNAIFQHIYDEMNGKIPTNITDWLHFHEFQSKSVSLLMHIWGMPVPAVPVDSHVERFIRANNLCHAQIPHNNTEEIAWELAQWVPPHLFIPLNDAIGSIGQKFKEDKSLVSKAYAYNKEVGNAVAAFQKNSPL